MTDKIPMPFKSRSVTVQAPTDRDKQPAPAPAVRLNSHLESIPELNSHHNGHHHELQPSVPDASGDDTPMNGDGGDDGSEDVEGDDSEIKIS